MIPPAECQQEPAPIEPFVLGALPPPAEAIRHARAVADQSIDYADRVRTEAEERRLVQARCADFNRRTAAEQMRGTSE